MQENRLPFIEEKAIAWEDQGGGVRRKILGYDPGLMMTVVEFKKGSIGYLHKHPHRQVTYVKSGSFEVQVDGKKHVLRSGDCFFILPDLEHGVVALEDSCLVDVFTPAREDFLVPKK
jgi:quercetin dioxygenase-like cupin family protein